MPAERRARSPVAGSRRTPSCLTGSSFKGSLRGASELFASDFAGSPREDSSVRASGRPGSDFTGSDFTGSDFTGSDFTASDFTASDFTGSDFTGSTRLISARAEGFCALSSAGVRPSLRASSRSGDQGPSAPPSLGSRLGAPKRLEPINKLHSPLSSEFT
ncbi:MAG: pentapeptide repeat-containing protein [Myxococcota bacterium]